jgi:hypothetical protein
MKFPKAFSFDENDQKIEGIEIDNTPRFIIMRNSHGELYIDINKIQFIIISSEDQELYAIKFGTDIHHAKCYTLDKNTAYSIKDTVVKICQ